MNLIENPAQAWRFASVRLAALAGIITAWAAQNPADAAMLWNTIVTAVPEPARPVFGLAVFAVPALLRVIRFKPNIQG